MTPHATTANHRDCHRSFVRLLYLNIHEKSMEFAVTNCFFSFDSQLQLLSAPMSSRRRKPAPALSRKQLMTPTRSR
jgi:hypothetical protein